MFLESFSGAFVLHSDCKPCFDRKNIVAKKGRHRKHRKYSALQANIVLALQIFKKLHATCHQMSCSFMFGFVERAGASGVAFAFLG